MQSRLRDAERHAEIRVATLEPLVRAGAERGEEVGLHEGDADVRAEAEHVGDDVGRVLLSPLRPVSLPSVAQTARAKIPTTIAEKMNDSTGSQSRPFSDFRTAQLDFARAQDLCMRVMPVSIDHPAPHLTSRVHPGRCERPHFEASEKVVPPPACRGF